MKTLFDKTVRDELLNRIQSLEADSKARWGKMDVVQMARHCNKWNSWVLGKGGYNNHVYKQDLLGKIFGKMALRSNTKNDKPMGRNMPAGALVIKDRDGNLETEKAHWIQLIGDYATYSNDRFIHDFFGKMTREQIGIFAYKHLDHHLRQFGA
ncbi:DUF1569 domain-containing protein [Niabella beijingensis]|uniref:DUF1569 domain-containing protein n=1 Tax=Niabella beijingensis TaxID=2872700 RepID=UPI001CBD83E6|nr:DUF1569 domain-containing protein [Niabella beijingensis]MBZ4188116.1 DUF1569 domain-containing protein [Niabella beijingensis]